MPRAELSLTMPEGPWAADLTRAHPDLTVRVLAAVPAEDGGVGLAELTAPDLAPVLRELDHRDDPRSVELLGGEEESALVRFETGGAMLLQASQAAGVPIQTPFAIQDGEVSWEVTAPRERLSELADQLEGFGVSFTVEAIRERIESEQLLTDRQRAVVEAAVEHGYYDTPREISLTGLAEELGVAKSTCSETLHRAEAAIVKQFVEGLNAEPSFG